MLPPTDWLGRRDWGPAPPTTSSMSPTLLCAADLLAIRTCTPLHLQVISPIGLGLTYWMGSGLCRVIAIRMRYFVHVRFEEMGASHAMETWPCERFSWEFGSVSSLAEAGCVGRD